LNKVSYAEALKKVRETVSNNKITSGTIQRSMTLVNQTQNHVPAPTKNSCEHKCKVDDDTLIVKKVNFVGFICHTINVAYKLKKKSDRIKSIEEAAGKFLEMKDIKADHMSC